MKKKKTAIAMITALLCCVLAGCGTPAPSEEGQGSNAADSQEEGSTGKSGDTENQGTDEPVTLTIWSYTEHLLTPVIEGYQKEHPDVEFEVTYVAGDEIYQKLVASLTTGLVLPDMVAHEVGQRGEILSLDVWENLEKAEYGLDKNVFFDASASLITNPDGEVVCIPWDMDMCGLAYKRDLALEYFGTDDPAALEEMMPDWPEFIAEGRKVLEESGNKVYMFASLSDAATIVSRQNAAPYLAENGALDLKATWGNAMNILADMRDAGIAKGLSMWTPAWASSFGEKDCIFYPCATWMPMSYITEYSAEGDVGNWGLMMPPEGACIWGGTAVGLTNTSSHKAEAWDFMNYFLSEEGIQISKDSSGFFTHVESAYEKEEFTSWSTDLFGAQDIGKKFFSDAFMTVQARPVTEYDQQIENAANLVLQSMITDKSIDGEKAVEMMAEELVNAGLELEIIQN